MASRKATASRPRTTKGEAAGEQDYGASDVHSQASAKSIAPLIPKRLAYKYDHGLMQEHYDNLLRISKAHHAAHKDVTPKRYQTANLVTLICKLYEKNLPEQEHAQCDEAVKKCLPVREHHVAFMTHSMFVTMVGMIVARALEQANAAVSSKKVWDDLLLDRYYVRNITTHDSSKTSALENAAYSGIMAYFIEKDQECHHHDGIDPDDIHHHDGIDPDDILTPMANYGLQGVQNY